MRINGPSFSVVDAGLVLRPSCISSGRLRTRCSSMRLYRIKYGAPNRSRHWISLLVGARARKRSQSLTDLSWCYGRHWSSVLSSYVHAWVAKTLSKATSCKLCCCIGHAYLPVSVVSLVVAPISHPYNMHRKKLSRYGIEDAVDVKLTASVFEFSSFLPWIL